MKYTEFTYTKKTGDVSQRAIVVTGEPNKFMQGIEVSDMSEADFAAFLASMRELQNRHEAERNFILQQYDLKHSFRQFDPQLISDQTVEWV